MLFNLYLQRYKIYFSLVQLLKTFFYVKINMLQILNKKYTKKELYFWKDFYSSLFPHPLRRKIHRIVQS